MSEERAATIRTERLLLRRARADDVEAMFRLLGNDKAMRYWSFAPHRRREETEEWLGKMIDSPAGLSNDYIVELEGLTIGKVGSWRLPEIGFIIDPAQWGKGLAREAAAAVIDDTFSRFDLPALKADVDPRNGRSLRLLESLGFDRSGSAKRTWFVNQVWADSLYFTLTRETWSKGRFAGRGA